ncbi:MAG: hypothetical protein K0Q67_3148 [Cellvibrio sp.]|jgi:hypothetical protein|nr:hypothetical protein [Cellvibrio sp.]MDF3012134.1 hypothetical protein [Cellvibrio sp.]
MRKASNNSGYFNGENVPQMLRAQPRKSADHAHKHASHRHYHENDDGERHTHHHHEPAKNAVRIELRRIQRLF